MLFNSFSFLVFFPVVVILYYIIPKRFQWILLLSASYYFYMCWNPKYIILLSLSTLITYISSLIIAQSRTKYKKKLAVIGCISSNLAILLIFKYLDWTILNLNHFFKLDRQIPEA